MTEEEHELPAHEPPVEPENRPKPKAPRSGPNTGRQTPHEDARRNVPPSKPNKSFDPRAMGKEQYHPAADDYYQPVDDEYDSAPTNRPQATPAPREHPVMRQFSPEQEDPGMMACEQAYREVPQSQGPANHGPSVPMSDTQKNAPHNTQQHARRRSETTAPGKPQAGQRSRSYSTSAYDQHRPAGHEEIIMRISPETDRESELLEECKHASVVKSEKLKDLVSHCRSVSSRKNAKAVQESELRRLKADHEHLSKQHDLLGAKSAEDERRFLELRREADSHRNAAIVTVGKFQKARQDFSAM